MSFPLAVEVCAPVAVASVLTLAALNRAQHVHVERERARREHEQFRREGHPGAPDIHLAEGPWWCLFAPVDRPTAELDQALDNAYLCHRCRPYVFEEYAERVKEGQR